MKINKVFHSHFTKLFVVTFLTFFLCGCSKSNSTSDMESEEETESNKIEAVVVCNHNFGKNNLYYYNIAIKSNGEYVTFDNDADYQELCMPLFFLQKVVNATEFIAEKYGFEYSEWINSPEHTELLESLPNIVDLYLKGRKNEIRDNRILKMIDEVWYNFHPDRMSFQLESDRYGLKAYGDYETNRGVFFRDNEYENYEDLNGNILPTNALVAYGG